MDVSCPRCQAEYELDDTRVTEDGVTVKCTSCQHVFRVKKKSLVVTLPVRPGDPQPGAQPPPPVGELPPAPPLREWKLRQPNGNIYPCRDLTMLQKWIIEGKVQRDDEISLTGETWKRLGNIPELASFFQVVDDAAKARALDAIQKSPPSGSPPVQQPPPPPGGKVTQGKITDTWRGGTFSGPAPEQPVPVDDASATLPPSFDELPARRRDPLKETLQGGRFSAVPPPPPPAARREPELPPPPPPRAPVSQPSGRFSSPSSASRAEPSDDELRKAVGGGGGKWIALVLAGLAVGGGVGWYLGVYQPEQERLTHERAAEQARLDEEARVKALAEANKNLNPPVAVIDAGAPPVIEVDAGVADAGIDAGTLDAGFDAGTPVVDAGTPVIDAGTPSVDAGAGPEPKKSFEFYLAQGERLREREKTAQALDYYGRAHELKPERVEPLAGRGLCLLDMGNPTAAIASFEQALQLGPRYGPAIMGMAEALRMAGKNEQAIEYYQKYLDVLPNGSEAAVARNSIERLKK
ncbi:MAG: zinc-ribbon domain-containing protein [Archangium sp.]